MGHFFFFLRFYGAVKSSIYYVVCVCWQTERIEMQLTEIKSIDVESIFVLRMFILFFRFVCFCSYCHYKFISYFVGDLSYFQLSLHAWAINSEILIELPSCNWNRNEVKISSALQFSLFIFIF